MNKNRNILITIGIIALASGQLYGLSPRQLAKLRRLETELKGRFAGSPRSEQKAHAWLQRNREIMGEIRKLDRPTANKYQNQLKTVETAIRLAIKSRPKTVILTGSEIPLEPKFEEVEFSRLYDPESEIPLEPKFEEVESLPPSYPEAELPPQYGPGAELFSPSYPELKEEEKRAEEKLEFAVTKEEKITSPIESLAAARPINEKIQEVQNNINYILGQSPDNFGKINFSPILDTIEDIKKMRGKVANKFLMMQNRQIVKNITDLKTQLVNAFFANLKNLSKPIIEEIDEMENYIHTLDTSKKPFKFDKTKIDNIVENQIIPRLKAISQNKFFSKITTFTPEQFVEEARQDIKNIVNSVTKFLDRFIVYIGNLNSASKSKKQRDKLVPADFTKTAQAMLTVKWVGDELYFPFAKILDRTDRLLENTIDQELKNQDESLFQLKKELYTIYGVEPAFARKKSFPYRLEPAEGKITINYLDKDGEKQWDQLEDPLQNINPPLAEILAN